MLWIIYLPNMHLEKHCAFCVFVVLNLTLLLKKAVRYCNHSLDSHPLKSCGDFVHKRTTRLQPYGNTVLSESHHSGH